MKDQEQMEQSICPVMSRPNQPVNCVGADCMWFINAEDFPKQRSWYGQEVNRFGDCGVLAGHYWEMEKRYTILDENIDERNQREEL